MTFTSLYMYIDEDIYQIGSARSFPFCCSYIRFPSIGNTQINYVANGYGLAVRNDHLHRDGWKACCTHSLTVNID